MRSRYLALALAALVLSMTACSGNGLSGTSNGLADQSVDQILQSARSAADAQTSVRLVSKGSQGQLDVITDMKLSRSGTAVGTLSIGAQQVNVRADGTNMWLQAKEPYWLTKMPKEFATAVKNLWVKIPIGSKNFPEVNAVARYSDVMTEFLAPEPPVVKGTVGTTFNQPAIQLVTSGGVLWVATNDVPLPVEYDFNSVNNVVRFGEWGTKVEFVQPTKAETIDLPSLGGGVG